MSKTRQFKPELKAKLVLQVLTGAKSPAQVCREHNLHLNLLSRWKTQFIENASVVFEKESTPSDQQDRIAELERMVGRLTMELEVSKKASDLLSYQSHKSGRS
jgi:transposase-like protein